MPDYGGGNLASNRMPTARAEIWLLKDSANEAASAGQYIPYGAYNLHMWGDWDSAQAKIQVSPDDGTTWYDVEATTRTTDGAWSAIQLDAFAKVRGYISGGGGSTSLNIVLASVE